MRIAAPAVLAAVAVLSLPGFGLPGLELDEGSLLVYPERVLEGDVPQRDFETFYGPGSHWLLAGVYSVFDATPTTERTVGLIYRLVIVASMLFLGLVAGRLIGLASGLLAGVLLLGIGLAAGSALGAMALALLGIALGARALRDDARTAGRWALGAGLALGAAVLFRFDFAFGVLPAALPIAFALPRPARRRLGLGLLIGLAPYIPHLLLVGPDAIERVATDLLRAGPGRRLPLPPLSSDLGQLIAAQATSAVLLVAVGALAWRGGGRDRAATTALSTGLLAVGLQPYVVFRPDGAHVLPVAALSVPLAPWLSAVIARSLHRERREATAAGAATAVLIAFFLAPSALRDRAKHEVGVTLGLTPETPSYEVRRGERYFPLGSPRDAHAVQSLLRDVERHSQPGQTLFTGPRDLRRTSYSDTFLYYLLPELEPGSFYLELNPGTASRPDSGLADDLGRTDVLILNRRWDAWNEPNASSERGSNEPNRVVATQFCLRSGRGSYELHVRCRRREADHRRSSAASRSP